jgi:hypothetical protein
LPGADKYPREFADSTMGGTFSGRAGKTFGLSTALDLYKVYDSHFQWKLRSTWYKLMGKVMNDVLGHRAAAIPCAVAGNTA